MMSVKLVRRTVRNIGFCYKNKNKRFTRVTTCQIQKVLSGPATHIGKTYFNVRTQK